MNRKNFIKTLAMIPLSGAALKLQSLSQITSSFETTELMPVLFIGHGSPMNAIEDNRFTKEIKLVAKKIPKPKAILMVSAHWETKGTYVTAMEQPKTIHDFGGFPKSLYNVQYPAPGSLWLAKETQENLVSTQVNLDYDWGFDHGCWSVTKNLYPNADVPVIQLSLDYTKGAQEHFELAKQLFNLRKKGVLVIGSGNMVHNFGFLTLAPGHENDFNYPFGHDWALEANECFKNAISKNDFKSLIAYKTISRATSLAAPTPEHFLPLLYAIALRDPKDEIQFFNDSAIGGSFTMTSVLMGKL